MFKRLKLYLHFLKSMFKVNYGLLVGMWKLTKLPQPAITIFGGSRLSPDRFESKLIHKLAGRLVEDGFSIITGGGPGLMEAANFGAYEIFESKENDPRFKLTPEQYRNIHRRTVSFGINLSNLQETNKYVQSSIMLPYFFTRKWLLVRYAVGFIVGPGGFGTMDELAEVITLIQTHRMIKTPVILIGKEYWKPFIDWIETRALAENLIFKEDADIIFVTDDENEAFNLVVKTCRGFPECGINAKQTE